MSKHTQIGRDDISPIQSSEKTMGIGNTIFLWIAATLVIPTVATGQLFVPDVSPYGAFGTVIIASLIGCIALAAIAIIGTKTGLPTFVASRATFGHNGSKIFAALNIVILCGWQMIQGYMGGLALNQVLIGVFSYDNIVLSIFVTQAIVLIITILGHTGIQKIEGITSSFMLVVAFIVIYTLLDKHGLTKLEQLPLSESPGLTYAIIFDIVLATAFSWMALPCDHNRYCKSVKTSASGITIGYLSGTMIAMGLGIAVGAYSIIEGFEPTYDPSKLLEGNFGIAAALVMFLSVATTNVLNLYSIVMSTMSIIPKTKFSLITIIFGLFCLSGSFLQETLMASFFDWILLVGALIIPVFAIMLSDYYLINKSNLNVDAVLDPLHPKYRFYKGVNLNAIFTYVISSTGSFYFTYYQPLDIGVTALTFICTAIIYLILSKLLPSNNQIISNR